MRVALAAGRVELAARVDLVVGPPVCDVASVGIVEVKSGSRRPGTATTPFYALVETLRSAAPPFVVATYYTRTGELDVDPVTPSCWRRRPAAPSPGSGAAASAPAGRGDRPPRPAVCRVRLPTGSGGAPVVPRRPVRPN